MDDFGLGLADLREGAKRFRKAAGGPAGGQRRMTFPCSVSIRLRSGGLLETDGRERGGSGASIDEQEQVVAQKFDAVRDVGGIPKAWRRRPQPAATA